MSDARFFQKCKAEEIRNEIAAHEKKAKNIKHKKLCMKRIIANVTMGNNEMLLLFPQVVQFYSIDDIEMKRMCCNYFASYFFASPDKLLEHKAAFFQDLHNGTAPIARALALQTIVQFPVPEFQEAVAPFLARSLRDPDNYVRKTAVFAVGKLFELNPALAESAGLIDSLNRLLLDTSPIVVASALAVLDYIVEHSASIKISIDEENVSNLLKILPKANEFSQSYILNSLLYYVPQTNSDSINAIDKVLPYLQHSSTAVVMNALKVIIYISNYVKAPQDAIGSLPKRIGSSLISLLSKPAEIQFLVLRNVILLLLSKPFLVKLDVTMFFCQYSDPLYVKDTKLEIIYLLANSSNLKIVLRELEEYATEVDVQMARKSIRAIGNLAIKLDDAAVPCTDVLVTLSSSGIPFIVQETVIVIKNIYRKYPGKFNAETIDMFVLFTDLIEEPEAKCSFLWIIGAYSDLIPNALELLKDYTFSIKEEPLEVQLTLLTAVVKFYLRNPQRGEQLLLKILKIVTEDLHEPDLRDRGYFYWRLLSSQKAFPESGKDMVLTELPEISAEQDKLDRAILEELELAIGTLASIYLKPITLVFRLAKPKYLAGSPALQVDYNRTIKSSDLNATADAVPEKVLKINIKSNIGTIKSPKFSSNGGSSFIGNSIDGRTSESGDVSNMNSRTNRNYNSYGADKHSSDLLGDQRWNDFENEVDYNPKTLFEKQRFLTKKKSKELLGFVSGKNHNGSVSSHENSNGNGNGSDPSTSYGLGISSNAENGGAGSSKSPRLDVLKRRMTFTRRKSVVSPRDSNRNFIG